jgi:ferric-dicitrate binding protein FerR (iron transport regulator)
MSDYLFDKEGEDAEVARLEQLLHGHAHAAPLRPLAPRRKRWAPAAAIAGLAAAAAAVLVLAWPDSKIPLATTTADAVCGPNGQGFAFATEGGAAKCGEGAIASGVLPIGEWLETSEQVSARVEVADIGNLTVHGGSRLRLVETGPDEHRLELARGRVSALVAAPPRLFVIDTPGASAVDLGCEYELAVDDEGRTHLAVTTGAVSLEGHGLVAYVAAGSEVVAVPGRGPGTPTAIGTGQPLRDAVARFDAGDSTALEDLLALAEPRDAVTLWNLLDRTEGDARTSVARRLEALHPASAHDHEEAQPEQPTVHGQQCQSEDAPWLEPPGLE